MAVTGISDASNQRDLLSLGFPALSNRFEGFPAPDFRLGGPKAAAFPLSRAVLREKRVQPNLPGLARDKSNYQELPLSGLSTQLSSSPIGTLVLTSARSPLRTTHAFLRQR